MYICNSVITCILHIISQYYILSFIIIYYIISYYIISKMGLCSWVYFLDDLAQKTNKKMIILIPLQINCFSALNKPIDSVLTNHKKYGLYFISLVWFSIILFRILVCISIYTYCYVELMGQHQNKG